MAAGKLTVPIAATFPVGEIREAVRLQAGRRVHGRSWSLSEAGPEAGHRPMPARGRRPPATAAPRLRCADGCVRRRGPG
ncbi:hypothetical protein ACH4GE_37600 [Streptomyces tendae]|uniref:hypothetical protein n=1 Tax=Streptomyces tendae TaxID=1932 RepID=UPI0037A2D717